MTLPSSGPLSLSQIWAEYGLPANSRFPQDIYGKPGLPSSGPLGFNDLYGKSNNTLVTDKSNLNASWVGPGTGFNSDFATITGNNPCTFSKTTISGIEPSGLTTLTTQSDRVARYTISTPNTGNFDASWTIRITASFTGGGSLSVDITCTISRDTGA